MENEELFAGEPAFDTQQLMQDPRHAAIVSKNTPLRVHTEPLLADGDSDDEWPQYTPPVRDADSRPRWRRPHVSDPGLIALHKISDLTAR